MIKTPELLGKIAWIVKAAGGGNLRDTGGRRRAEQRRALHEPVFQKILHRTVTDCPVKAAQAFPLAQTGGPCNSRKRDRLRVGAVYVLQHPLDAQRIRVFFSPLRGQLWAELLAAVQQQAGKALADREFIRECIGLQRGKGSQKASAAEAKALSLKEVLGLRGVKNVLVCFFCYCALEQTTGLWASSYLTLYKGVPAETAAFFSSMFFIGITAGRALNGFLAMKLSDVQMVRIGQLLLACGVVILFLPLGADVSLAGFVMIGLGCAPIYPCLIHATPEHFGADKSQAVIGIQMACAYVGTSLMPPLFGLIARHITVSLLPVYLAALLALMIVMHESLIRKRLPASL